MADDPELLSDSESDDEDFVPGGVENVSEEESGSGSEEESGKEEKQTKRKNGKTKRAKSKKLKIQETEEKEEEDVAVKLETPEELKKKSDALWADFIKAAPPNKSDRVSDLPEEKENSQTPQDEPKKVKVSQIFDFAGEKVEVDKEMEEKIPIAPSSARGLGRGTGRGRGRGGGLTSLLSQLGKKGKLSTLEKSKLDWDKFKKQEGINEELQLHNKGKNGYLERQDFLQRTDLRQFEIEKGMRAAKRSFN